jgi:tetratricopeptide (TPR) repeat protein
MPERFVLFHNGHAALYEYAHAPERKAYMDARLEVIGPELYREYVSLERVLRNAEPGWHEALMGLGSPGVLVDNVHASFAANSATLMGDSRWMCVWFDPVAAVYVPSGSPGARETFGFLRRHFVGIKEEPRDAEWLKGQARAGFEVGFWLVTRGAVEASRPLVLHAIGAARRYRELRPEDAYGWRLLALLETLREPELMAGSAAGPIRRYLRPFDPVNDLSAGRAATLGVEALRRNPEDAKVGLSLASLFLARGLDDAALPLFERLATFDPARQTMAVTASTQTMARGEMEAIRGRLGPQPSSGWQNRDELTRNLEARLQRGWVRSAAEFLEAAYPPASRTWPVADRIGTLWLHVGEAERARAAWAGAVDPPRPSLVASRVGAALYAQDDLDGARKSYGRAVELEPDLFEAHYGLACVARDAGDASDAMESGRKAATLAPHAEARRAAELIVSQAEAGRGDRTGDR